MWEYGGYWKGDGEHISPDPIGVSMKKLLVVGSLLGLLGGCSATSLRCGTDGESSFVDLVNMPQDISSQSRNFKELCSFAYEGESDAR